MVKQGNNFILSKYPPINPILKQMIKYYWTLHSSKEIAMEGAFLPMNNIDILINLSQPINYIEGNIYNEVSSVHFIGIHNKTFILKQNGILDVIGISFQPFGSYPLIKIPINEFADSIQIMKDINSSLQNKLEDLHEINTDIDRILKLEEILINEVCADKIIESKYANLISKFASSDNLIRISAFCERTGVNQRTFERMFQKYTGTSPQNFIKLSKFQRIIKTLMRGDFESLTDVAYEYDYFDQTHFIKDFKSLSGGITPRNFNKSKILLEYFLR